MQRYFWVVILLLFSFNDPIQASYQTENIVNNQSTATSQIEGRTGSDVQSHSEGSGMSPNVDPLDDPPLDPSLMKTPNNSQLLTKKMQSNQTALPTRISGKDRFEVATNIAKHWNKANTVVLANYMAFADALTAAPLAFKYDAPILLTHPNQLSEETKREIIRLKASKVIVVGGPGSISEAVISELNDLKLTVNRIGGKDRFEVAENIASEVGITETVAVANAYGFADALSIAPYASVKKMPILLTKQDGLQASTKKLLDNSKVKNSIIIGGESSVGANVEKQLPSVKRISGKDRYEVAANVASTFGKNVEHYYVATGLGFADALTGSALAAKNNAMILLTDTSKLPPSVINIVKRELKPITILGGTGSVKDSVVSEILEQQPTNRSIVYFVPHQDDEILTFSVDIRNELSKGRDVHLVLLTSGEDSKAREVIIGMYDKESNVAGIPPGQAVWCSWHRRYHNSKLEHYKHGHLTRQQFGLVRTDEYVRASHALGVRKENIHTDFIPKFDMANIRASVQLYLKRYPNAEIRSMSWFDGHSAHALIGQTIKSMQQNGELLPYQAKYFTSIYTDRFYPVPNPLERYKVGLTNNSDVKYVNNAIYEYMRFEPINGYYAVGYHSVQSQFESLRNSPYTKTHY